MAKSKVMSGQLNIYNDELTQGSSFTVGKVYIVDDLKSGDNFSNIGFVSVGVPFLCTGTTPTSWSNGSYVLKQNLSLIHVKNEIDLNAYIVKVNQNIFQIKVTNGGFKENKTVPIIGGGSNVRILDTNTIEFSNQIFSTFYRIEVEN